MSELLGTVVSIAKEIVALREKVEKVDSSALVLIEKVHMSQLLAEKIALSGENAEDDSYYKHLEILVKILEESRKFLLKLKRNGIMDKIANVFNAKDNQGKIDDFMLRLKECNESISTYYTIPPVSAGQTSILLSDTTSVTSTEQETIDFEYDEEMYNSLWEIDRKQIKDKVNISRSIWKAKYNEENVYVVWTNLMSVIPEEKEKVERFAKISTILNDKDRFIPVIKIYEDPDSGNYVFVAKAENCQPLSNMFNHHEKLTNTEKINIAYDIAISLGYLHSWNVIHRGIMSDFVYIDNDTKKARLFPDVLIKLVPKEALSRVTSAGGRERWFAPEKLNRKDPSESTKSDIYMFGVFLWELAEDGKMPYSDMTPSEAEKEIIKGNILRTEELGDDYSLLIEYCCSEKPNDRPSILAVIKHLELIKRRAV